MEPLKLGQSYRCTACGGLTRFTVTVTRTVRYYHHQAIGGGMAPEMEEVLREVVESVECIWCGNGRSIEVMEGLDTSES